MGLNSFLLAVAEDNIELALLFIHSKKVDINSKDSFGRTALHYAAANGDVKMVKLLIEAGVDPNAKNNALETPLMKACQFIELYTIEYLMNQPQVEISCLDIVTST